MKQELFVTKVEDTPIGTQVTLKTSGMEYPSDGFSAKLRIRYPDGNYEINLGQKYVITMSRES